MTRIPRLSKPQKVELGPNQIYIKSANVWNRVHTLVEGSTDWSYYTWDLPGQSSLYLHYKGVYVSTLRLLEPGKWADEHFTHPDPLWKLPIPPCYSSLAEAVAVYEQAPNQLAIIDALNKEGGLDVWCVRHSFTPASVSVTFTLPPEERERLERLAQFDARSLEEMIVEALYKHLATVEERFNELQRWRRKQSQREQKASEQKASEEVGA
jgi:predicted DNA-binding protein